MTPSGTTAAVTGATVLVADDDDDLRAVVVEALQGDGYRVVTAQDGEELVSIVVTGSTRPDVVLLDVRMPRLSGLGVLIELRRANIDVPILMMTGFSPDAVDVVARRLGAVGMLKKPFQIDALRAAVMNARWR